MIADSYYLSGFSCFGSTAVGFPEFKPVTVVIGRNNSGKSQLLDLVALLSGPRAQRADYPTSGQVTLNEGHLKSIFKENTSGGELGGNHWSSHGQHLVGASVTWKSSIAGKLEVVISKEYTNPSDRIQSAREQCVGAALARAESPLEGKHFRRLLADRDISPELPSVELKLAPSGVGATNIIRRHIVSTGLNESVVQDELLSALDEIFGHDGEFQQIEIRQHDESESEGEGDLWEVFLREPGKGLIPLSSSGSGLKTVILVLLNLIAVPSIEKRPRSEYLFAFEELENNLHPALLRRLFDFVLRYVRKESCRLYLTTHSSVALDFFSSHDDTQIVHVSHDGDNASVKVIQAHLDRVELISELGAKPSDLLQSNGIIWLEGPSDRIYMNRLLWLYSDGELREGRDYQCAYYGGSVLAKIEFAPEEKESSDFTNLLRLNNNIAVVCDGDRTAANGAGSRIKGRVQRIKKQVELINGAFFWITDAKEIENYIPGTVWASVYGMPEAPDPDQFDSFPSSSLTGDHFVVKELNRKSFDKCDFATSAAPQLTRELLRGRFDLEQQMLELVAIVRRWNA